MLKITKGRRKGTLTLHYSPKRGLELVLVTCIHLGELKETLNDSKLIPTLPFNYVTLLREEAIDLDLDIQYYEHMFILV